MVAWIAHIRTALIEQNALDGIVQNGVERAVTPYQCTMVVPLLLEVDDTHRVRRLLGVFLQILLGQPTFHATTAFVGLDESDGNIEGLIHHLGKEIARSREFANSLGRTLAPLGVGILLWSHAHDAGNLGRAYLSLACCIDDFLVVVQHRTIAKTLDRHLHVRLSGTDPYLASHHILDSHLPVTIVKGNRQRLVTGLGRLHRQQPTALFVSLRLATFIAPRRGGNHLLARLGPTPQTDICLLLYHHVITYQMRQLYFGLSSHCQARCEE